MDQPAVRKISRGYMAVSALATLVYELVMLTPLKRLWRNLTTHISVQKKTVGAITLTEYRKSPGSGGKLVLLLHGYGSMKERMHDFAIRLAKIGYIAITPDAIGHGERTEPGARSIIQIVAQSVKEVDTLIDHYRSQPGVDINNFCIVGRSMGGLTSYSYLIHGKYKPKVIAPCISSPDTKDLMNYRLGMSFYENHKTGHLEEPADIARRNADLEAASVFEQVVRSTGTAVIVQNMRFDFLVASTGSDKLHQRWKEREREGSYRYDKPLAFFHYIPDVAKWNVIRFMKQHL